MSLTFIKCHYPTAVIKKLAIFICGSMPIPSIDQLAKHLGLTMERECSFNSTSPPNQREWHYIDTSPPPIHPKFLRCPEAGCVFTYPSDQVNKLKTHRTKVHVPLVKLIFREPPEEVMVPRTDEIFQCPRCPFSTPYPTVIQRHAKNCTLGPSSPLQEAFHRQMTASPVLPALSMSNTRLPSPPPHNLPMSLSCSPQELPPISIHDYTPFPDENTVVHHPPYNLPSMGIIINTHFRCIICLNCQRAVNASNLIEHVRKDLPLVEVSEDLPSILEAYYNLLPYASIVYGRTTISPVFGIPLEKNPIYFCDCGKGYATYETLRTHQTRVGERSCLLRQQSPSYHQGYGQRLTGHRNFFEVDPSRWCLAPNDYSHFPLAFSRSLPPLRDYSKMEIKGAEDEMNTSSFFFTQRWLAHLEGFSPEDVNEVTKQLSPDAPFGERLRQVAEEFLSLANAQIKKHNSFGILKLIGQTTERETLHRFDAVSEKTVKKYALTLHRLVYGVIRQMEASYPHKYRYPPLHATQLVSLHALRRALEIESLRHVTVSRSVFFSGYLFSGRVFC
ncbi:hypothetical protein BYT27DRAFT_7261632 [Phlegmacium glaucopus]|nr:hypothetical protein BYT27DRAFT_7261632 [Phlegmacium glaucopus]